LTKINGKQLFGLEDSTTQSILQKFRIPTCRPDEWHDEQILTHLFDYYLKRRTKSNINWRKFFIDWSNQAVNIIELTKALREIYSNQYQLSERELEAWRSMLKASGCTRITPFPKNVSPVSKFFALYMYDCGFDLLMYNLFLV